MREIVIEVDTVRVETNAERGRIEGAAPVVQEAFRILARRLERTPFRDVGTRDKLLERLEVSALPLDELLSARGAERLAEELYVQILRRAS